MDEMTATFEPTPEVRELLGGKPAEYIVVNPVAIEAEFKDGRVVRYPQEIRGCVVRCRDCSMYDAEDGMCMRDPEHTGCGWYARPDGFCAWGKPKSKGVDR